MKKCAVINDLSGFGKCSLGVAIPIISVMGCEVHPLPTAVLSNQTAYESFKILSLTDEMISFYEEWKKLNAHFDAILTGFITNEKQLDVMDCFIDEFKNDSTILVVDPIMADNGKLYDGYTEEMCKGIIKLCRKADIITPNIAELAIIADEPYSQKLDDIKRYGLKLNEQGISKVVATGYVENDTISNLVFDNGEISISTCKKYGGYFSGTGDILSSIVTGGALRGLSLKKSVDLATSFIEKCVKSTTTGNENAGVNFEKYLGDLVL